MIGRAAAAGDQSRLGDEETLRCIAQQAHAPGLLDLARELEQFGLD